MTEQQLIMSKEDFDTLYTFRAICEQVLDYLGNEQGKAKLEELFSDNKEWVDAVYVGYCKGDRITERLDKPDEDILRMIG